MLRGSSLLFSKKFDEEHEFYLKSDFINKLYFYYIKKGYYNILSSEIVNLFTSIFTVGFIIFLYRCVDYNGLLDINTEKSSLYSYINWDNYFNLHWIVWFLLVNFGFFTLCKLLSIVNSAIIYKKIRKFNADKLKINDSQIQSMKWETIIDKLFEYYKNDTINVYFIANRITIIDNYTIALINKEIIDFSHLTSLMEWNITFCILNKIFNYEYKLHNNIFEKRQSYISSIKRRIRFIALINFILMPFILIFILFYNFFIYGERIYSKPASLFTYLQLPPMPVFTSPPLLQVVMPC